ncbi:uncharacterized protein TNCV_5105491 [Trichonephila clavipes]|nr:uncharacterized protein TNCV_5105491 [Trichonephila clavipes]
MSCGSPAVKVSDHARHVMSSSPVPLKTRRVGQRCTLNLPRAKTSYHWCGVVVRREGASSGAIHVTMVQNYVIHSMLTKYRMIKFIDFCEVWFLPESVARVAAIVGDHRCHTPRH